MHEDIHIPTVRLPVWDSHSPLVERLWTRRTIGSQWGLLDLVEPGEPLGEPGLGLGDFGVANAPICHSSGTRLFASLKWLNAEAEAKRLSIVISSKTGKPVLCLNRSLNLLNLVVTMRLLIKRSFFSKEFTSAIRSSTIFVKRTPRLFTSSAFTSKLKYRAQRTSCETSTPRISRRSKSMTMLQSAMKRGFIFSTSFWIPMWPKESARGFWKKQISLATER